MGLRIERILKRNRRYVDRAIEKYVPKHASKKSMIAACGKPRYAYAVETADRSVHDPIWELLSRGGKRWRPTLFLLVAEAFGSKPSKLYDLTVVPEVAHNGTLMVDDVEDDSDLRRGKPCIHRMYGVDVAVNAGTAMYFLPLLVFKRMKNRFPKDRMLKAYEIYAQEMINISYGQGFDIWWHRGHASLVTENEYLQMCAFKTGTLARMSAKLGALFAGATDNEIELAGAFAESIGIAFQIQDDLLNLSAQQSKYGKEIGGDISEGKRTLIVIHALKHASSKDRKRLLFILNARTKDQERVREAIAIMERTRSMEYAKAFSHRLVRNAWKRFSRVLKKSDAKEALKEFAWYLIEREL